MAKLSSIQKNLFRKKLIDKFRNKRELLKSKIKDKKLSLEERIAFAKKEFFTGLKQKSLYTVISKNLIDNQLMGGYNAN